MYSVFPSNFSKMSSRVPKFSRLKFAPYFLTNFPKYSQIFINNIDSKEKFIENFKQNFSKILSNFLKFHRVVHKILLNILNIFNKVVVKFSKISSKFSYNFLQMKHSQNLHVFYVCSFYFTKN